MSSRNLRVRIIHVLDATFVPRSMNLGLLSPEILLGEEAVTQTPTYPAYFVICEPQVPCTKQKTSQTTKRCIQVLLFFERKRPDGVRSTVDVDSDVRRLATPPSVTAAMWW